MAERTLNLKASGKPNPFAMTEMLKAFFARQGAPMPPRGFFVKCPTSSILCLLLLIGWLSCPSRTVAQVPPTIAAGPTNQVVAVGGTVTLSVSANGSTPLFYQWLKDSRLMVGATNSTLTVVNASVIN